jgi:hypothetical protein
LRRLEISVPTVNTEAIYRISAGTTEKDARVVPMGEGLLCDIIWSIDRRSREYFADVLSYIDFEGMWHN